jgi:hypothetical protein
MLGTVSNLDPRPAAVSLRAGVVHAVDVLEARIFRWEFRQSPCQHRALAGSS